MRFAAIDFETANAQRASACALGVVVVEAGVVACRRHWLIRPRELRFDPYNVMIHGITEADVRDKPEFHEVWPEVLDVLQGRPWLAHNAAFDFSVLRHTFDAYSIPYPSVNYSCTYQMAKRSWPGLLNYSLPTVAVHVGVQFRHHDPEEDAFACAQLALLSARQCSASGVAECAERLGIRMGSLFPGGYQPSSLRAPGSKASGLAPSTGKKSARPSRGRGASRTSASSDSARASDVTPRH